MSAGAVGSVGALWRFPVKSMQGEPVDAIDVGRGGLVGDRTYALVDVATGKVVSAKSARLFSRVLDVRARYLEPPDAAGPPAPVELVLPDGSVTRSDCTGCDGALSAFFGRDVRLVSTVPAAPQIDVVLPAVEGATPREAWDTTVEGPIGAPSLGRVGMPSTLAGGAFQDAFPVSLITTGTLGRLAALAPGSAFDPRRFRMNVVVDTPVDGFVENAWVERTLSVGPHVSLRVVMPDPRCIMTTVAQVGLPKDPGVLRALVLHNRLPAGALRDEPCAGVYATVERHGRLAAGAPVTIA